MTDTKIICERCGGKGQVDCYTIPSYKCSKCDGTGKVEHPLAARVRLLRAALEPFATHAVPCAGQPCPWCDARLAMMATEARP